MKKLDKRKVRRFLGQATLIILANLSMSVMLVYGFIQNTIY